MEARGVMDSFDVIIVKDQCFTTKVNSFFEYRAKTIEKTSVRGAEGCIGGLGLPGGRPADFLEFAFADSDPAEVVSELNR